VRAPGSVLAVKASKIRIMGRTRLAKPSFLARMRQEIACNRRLILLPMCLSDYTLKVRSYSLPIGLALGLRILLSAWLGIVWLVVDRYQATSGAWVQSAFGHLSPHQTLIGRALLDVWVRWDAVHYLNIAKVGYQGVGLGDMNFFPLYPALVWIAGILSFHETILAALLVSTLAAALALVVFYQLILDVFADQNLALWTVVVWALFPTSVFLFAPYSDALYAAIALGSLLALRRRRWLVGGVLASLAGLARAQGVLLCLPFLIGIARYSWNTPRKPLSRPLLGLLIAPLGFLGYIAWRGQHGVVSVSESFASYSGVFFANPLTTLNLAIRQALATGEVRVYLEIFVLVGCGAVLVWMLTQKRFNRQFDLIAYTVVTLGLFLVKHSQVASVYQSATRYVLSLFPVFIGIAALVIALPPVGRKAYLLLSSCGLLIVSTLYSLWFFVG
jgi:hypothetical protein